MVRGYAVHRLTAAMRAAAGTRFFASAPEAGAPILNSSSLKTALDLNWHNPVERQNALLIILNSLDSVE